MSKGLKARSNNLYTVQTREVDISDTDTEVMEEICWDFPLTDLTVFAKTMDLGTVVHGSILVPKQMIMVRAQGSPLGCAPPNISKEIIDIIKERGGRLSGVITSKDENGIDVWVRLCLN